MSILYYFIDEETRKLRPEAAHKVVAQKDHNADVIRVGIPETMDSVDLETSAVRCMYQRPKETEVRSKTATYYDTSGRYMWYDWTLQEGDTAKAGKIYFSVCLQHIESGLLSVDWNTTIGEIHIKTSYHSDDSDEGDESITPTVAQRVAVLETMIQRVASGAPIVVASTSAMTDTEQIYVLSTDGNWYYHNGTAWVSGGEYGAVATDTTLTQSGIPADAKTVGDAIDGVDQTIDAISGSAEPTILHISAEADNSSSYNRNFYLQVPVISGETYKMDFVFNECHFKNRAAGSVVFQVATATQASYNYLVDTIANIEQSYSAKKASYTFTATANASYLYVYCYTSLNTAVDIDIRVKSIRTLEEVYKISNDIGKSISGNPISFEFSTTYNYSSTARVIGTYTLTAGTYVLTYTQEEGAMPTSLSSRCTPWCKKPNNQNLYRKSDASGVDSESGEKYWVINLDADGDYAFYFWYRLMALDNGASTAHISNIQLFKIDTIKGTLYNDIAKNDTFAEIPYSFVSMYQRIGCVGDSWTAGSIYSSESTWAGTINNLTWCKNAERLTGSQFIQYAKGGLSARTWLTDMHGKIAVENTEPCPLYVVNLGINDAAELTDSTITLGQVDDFENQVEGTFFYYYGAVINCIKTHAPNAKIILETILIRSEKQVVVRNAIIEYAKHYEIPYVDMYADVFYRLSSVILVGGHPTAATHAGMAMANLRLFAKCIKDNPDYFKINTQSEYGDFSLIGIADSIGRNYVSSPVFYHRAAGTTHSADSYEITRANLLPGKYILKWSQTSATKVDNDSRCTPLYNFTSDSTKRYYNSGSNFPNVSAGVYRWVFDVSNAVTIMIYFWSKGLSEDFEAYDFDLYRYDSIRGRMDKLEGLVE